MKKITIVIAFLFSLTLTNIAQANVLATLVIDDNIKVEFTLPEGWGKNSKKIPYDLQHLAPDRNMNSAIFLYKKVNLAKHTNAQKVLNFHFDDLRNKRKNYELIESQKEIPLEQGKIISKTFAAEKNIGRNYYVVSAIEFEHAPDVILAIIQVSVPSEWKKNKPVLQGILQSAKIKK